MSKTSENTQVLSVFAQIMQALGFVIIIIGSVILIVTLIEEFSNLGGADEETKAVEWMAIIASGATLFYGMMLAAIGQVLACIRSITIDVNKMANSD